MVDGCNGSARVVTRKCKWLGSFALLWEPRLPVLCVVVPLGCGQKRRQVLQWRPALRWRSANATYFRPKLTEPNALASGVSRENVVPTTPAASAVGSK